MPRGSKPGERRGGRQKGTPNRATAEVKALAQKYAPAAIEELGRLSTGAESEAARVAAANSLLDRAYGKPMQPVAANIAMRDARKVYTAQGTRSGVMEALQPRTGERF